MGLSKHFIFTEQRITSLTFNKSSEEALDQALDKLVMVCPNKKTYDELTSLMFQLYCGNDFGLGNFSLSFLDKIEKRWMTGRKAAAQAKGLKLVVRNA